METDQWVNLLRSMLWWHFLLHFLFLYCNRLLEVLKIKFVIFFFITIYKYICVYVCVCVSVGEKQRVYESKLQIEQYKSGYSSNFCDLGWFSTAIIRYLIGLHLRKHDVLYWPCTIFSLLKFQSSDISKTAISYSVFDFKSFRISVVLLISTINFGSDFLYSWTSKD